MTLMLELQSTCIPNTTHLFLQTQVNKKEGHGVRYGARKEFLKLLFCYLYILKVYLKI